MIRAYTLLFCVLGCFLTCSCSKPDASAQSGGATSKPVIQPKLKAIDIHFSIYLARIDEHITITPEGLLRRAMTMNKSWGPNDEVEERTEIRQGQLTPAQIAEVAQLFVGWEKLSDKPYGSVPDGPEIEVRYGDRTASGGNNAPTQVWGARRRIQELADGMPLIP